MEAGPAEVPEPADVQVPDGAARDDRASHVALPGLALGGPAGAGRRAGGARLALPRGDGAGGGGDAGDPGLPRVGRELLRHAGAAPGGPPHDLRVHEPVLPAARRARGARRDVGGDRRPGRRLEHGRGVPPACVRMPGSLRPRPDGVHRGPLPRAARRRGRPHDRRTPARRASRPPTCCPRSASRPEPIGRPADDLGGGT